MKFEKTIYHLEWLMLIVICYYFFLACGVITLAIAEGANLSDIVKIGLFMIVILVSFLLAGIAIRITARHLYKIHFIKIILAYVSAMAILFSVLPLYINALLTISDVLPG